MTEENGFSRRRFLQFTGAAAGAAAALGMAGISAAEQGHAMHAAPLAENPLSRGRMFFVDDVEFAALSAAAERIFPKDDLGPGAVELAVPYFIDNQLAGAYGYNAREYTQGPFFPGAPTQGYQSPLLRRDLFRQGLAALNRTARERFKRDFAQLEEADQDRILVDCEAGKLSVPGAGSDVFFAALRGAVLAGVYADPIYNGNNNMDGWRMKQYPGAQMAYDFLMTSAKFEDIPPVSLSSMQ